MTLEMRDTMIREEARISYMIEILRKTDYSDEQILKILQKDEHLSEACAKEYLKNASDVIRQINDHITFMRNLCQLIAKLEKQNLQKDMIQLKLQEEFGFDDFDAEFYFDYVNNSEKYRKIIESFQ